MQILSSFNSFTPLKQEIVLTIGNFDGVHCGHQALLKAMNATHFQTVVVTFLNHPSEVFASTPTLYLTTLSHKLNLLETLKIDTVITLPFTKAFSEQSPQAFLLSVKKHIPFTHLFLGHDAVIGHQRKGNAEVLKTLSQELNFKLEYLKPVIIEGNIASSSLIRRYIQNGNLKTASLFLGRPYSIRGMLRKENNVFQFLVKGLCLPPSGVYETEICYRKKRVSGSVLIPSYSLSEMVLEVTSPYLTESCSEEEVEVFFAASSS